MHRDTINKDTAWRLALGQKVALAYGTNPKVTVAYVAGSVARGWADHHSDVEVDLYWREAPSELERRQAVQRSGGTVDVDWSQPPVPAHYRALLAAHNGHLSQIWPYENDEWSEHFYVAGVNVGVSAFLVETIEGWISDVIDRHDTDDDKHMRLAAIQQAVPVVGRDRLRQWQNRVRYDDQLTLAVVRELLEVNERWWDRWVLAGRGAHIPLYDLCCRVERWVLRLLLALNRMFLPDPRFKWAEHLAGQMTIRPPELSNRLRRVFQLDYLAAVGELENLVVEVLDLLDAHLPGAETGFAREWLSYRRAVWEESPGGA